VAPCDKLTSTDISIKALVEADVDAPFPRWRPLRRSRRHQRPADIPPVR